MVSNMYGKVFGIVGMVSAVLWIIALSIEFQFGLQPPGNGTILYYIDQLVFLAALTCELVMLSGMWRTKAAGGSVFGKISLGIFISGIASLVIGQIVLLLTNNANFILLPIGGLLQTLGVLLTGIAVLTAKHWTGWRRFTPLLQGLYFLIVLVIPVLALNQPLTLLGEGLYQVAWFLTSLALYAETRNAVQEKPFVAAMD